MFHNHIIIKNNTSAIYTVCRVSFIVISSLKTARLSHTVCPVSFTTISSVKNNTSVLHSLSCKFHYHIISENSTFVLHDLSCKLHYHNHCKHRVCSVLQDPLCAELTTANLPATAQANVDTVKKLCSLQGHSRRQVSDTQSLCPLAQNECGGDVLERTTSVVGDDVALSCF